MVIRYSRDSNIIQCLIKVIRFENDTEPKMYQESCLTNLSLYVVVVFFFLLLGIFILLHSTFHLLLEVNMVFELQMKSMGLFCHSTIRETNETKIELYKISLCVCVCMCVKCINYTLEHWTFRILRKNFSYNRFCWYQLRKQWLFWYFKSIQLAHTSSYVFLSLCKMLVIGFAWAKDNERNSKCISIVTSNHINKWETINQQQQQPC